MTPEEAAETLEVTLDASRAQIDRAYRRLARESHPDRLSGEALREQALAQAQFIRVTEARNVMLAVIGARDAAASAVRLPPKPNWVLLGTWVVVMMLAIAVSVVGSPLPLTVADPLLRFGLMMVSSVSFALTGRQIWLVLMSVSIAATAITTILFTTFGALLGMLLLAAPLYGLYVAGRARRPSPAR